MEEAGCGVGKCVLTGSNFGLGLRPPDRGIIGILIVFAF